MSKKPLKQTSDKKIHWFWNLTTKWWFFPLFWFFLSVLFGVIFAASDLFYYNLDVSWMIFIIFGIFMNMPQGLAYLILLLINLIIKVGYDSPSLLIILLTHTIFYVYFAVSIFKIVKSKNKENKILKRRIIILFLLILLGFIGLIVTNKYNLDFGLGYPYFGAP